MKQSLDPILYPSLPPFLFPSPYSRNQQQALQGAMNHSISHQRQGGPEQMRKRFIRHAGIRPWFLPILPHAFVAEEVEWGMTVVFSSE